MYSEDDLIPISALQHFVFCQRQWALIHLEQIWEENRLTIEGKAMHEKVDSHPGETRPGVRIARGLSLRSLAVGLTGRADVVEFQDDGKQVLPVEYKRGRPKPDWCDEAQLCAQAICLEEMLGVTIQRGEIFYGSPRRRYEVEFSADLRTATINLVNRVRAARDAGITPSVPYSAKCDRCSLIERCMPKAVGQTGRAKQWFDRMVRSS